ncbi:GGDEF domain-containing protein [Zhengella mangrovi]|uniref:diguanylate cyclase n=1 Tax=Zhengella mangrovi TaxID=1982044 RepID=A0A2G1QUH7_9HYPH|nr:GGDEF domain-containing protein [Zhengella mangrovi]PHP69114.1 GGDEF domain-containing protein [Zhengella mangrovi]
MEKAGERRPASALARLWSRLRDPVTGGMVVGTVALAAAVALIQVTFPAMGQEVYTANYVCAVLGSYGIGSPVAWYCLRQNRRLESLLVELEDMHALLKARSRVDAMTGLLNREAFFDEAEHVLKAGDGPALLILDIDRFKPINDTWGHLAGDRAIELVAAALLSAAPPSALVGRIGGEEFAVLLAGGDAFDVRRVAETLRVAVEAIEFWPADGMRQPLTISIGGSHAPHGSVVTDIVRRADRCLYQAKNAGRNRIRFDAAA